MSEKYTAIAQCYDEFCGTQPKEWAKYLDKIIKKHSKIDCRLVLDLGCGTGAVTRELAKIGYDMTGIDNSCDMLSIAISQQGNDILYLNQDMTSFELYGTVDAVVSTLDCVNYLLGVEQLEKCFSLVNNYLDFGGLFIFDVNTPYKFKNVYGYNAYVLENDDMTKFLSWQNFYDEKSKKCDFVLTVFIQNENGTYERYNEEQTEYCFSEKQIEKTLEKCGFKILRKYDEMSFDKPVEDSERIHYVCENIIKKKCFQKDCEIQMA